MITNINYNHFYYFWVVSNAGSIAKASKTLHLTPQTISAQISMLEQRLGKALFIRKGRQLVLSDYGRISKQYADDMFAIAEEWLETTQGNDTYLKTLKVGISDALPKSLVTRWLAPIINSDSNIKLTCIDGKQEELLSQLAIHKLDLLLSDTPADNNYNLKVFCHEIGKSNIGLYAPHALARELQPDFPRSLSQQRMVLPGKDSPTSRAIEYWLNTQHLNVSIVSHVDDSALMKAFGKQGLGIFPAPILIRDDVKISHEVSLIGQVSNVYQSYYLITPERMISDTFATRLLEQARMSDPSNSEQSDSEPEQ